MDYDLTELTDLAYDAVLAPARWTDFLARLAAALGGASVGLSLRHPLDADPGWIVFHDTDPEFGKLYGEHYFRVDPFRRRSDALPAGGCEIMSGGSVDAATVKRSTFYNEWMRPQGFAPAPTIGVTLDRDARGEPVGLGVFRPLGAREYGDAELRLLRGLVPHLQRATRMARRLARTEAELVATRDAVDALPVAALLLDANGNVVRANRKAWAVAEDGPPFQNGHGRLALQASVVAELMRVAATLRRGIAGGTPGFADEAIMVRRPPDGAPLWLRVLPCLAPELPRIDGPPGWLWVLIDDLGDGAPPSLDALTAVLGLTNAEARLVALLVTGRRLEQAAAELGIAHETARTHLKAAFRKTGARSQTDLVRIVLQRPLLVRRGS